MGLIKRGDIFLANLNPVKGSEQGGIRPVLVIQNDFGNKYSPTTIIAPITSFDAGKEYPTNVFLNKEDSKLKKESTILLNQIKTIDKRRLIKKVSSVNEHIMRSVDLAIKISLGLQSL